VTGDQAALIVKQSSFVARSAQIVSEDVRHWYTRIAARVVMMIPHLKIRSRVS
jgi:hypothetical protein